MLTTDFLCPTAPLWVSVVVASPAADGVTAGISSGSGSGFQISLIGFSVGMGGFMVLGLGSTD